MDNSNDKANISKSYIRLFISIFLILLLVIIAVEFVVYKKNDDAINLYKIETSRVEQEIVNAQNLSVNSDSDSICLNVDIDLSKYETIKGVYKKNEAIDAKSLNSDFYSSEYHYVIREINGGIYRIDYDSNYASERARLYKLVNFIICIFMLVCLLIMLYIYRTIIKNFKEISDYPYALAKGNLTLPLRENKNKYFGKFLWGLDMLREKLEEERGNNLELQKEKSVLMLSLSHDIKTPVSAIKLYAAAIKKNLYKDENKIKEVAGKIDNNANEIEDYVAKIISASNDDFLNFDVKTGDFYLSDAMNYITTYYEDKLENIGTSLRLANYNDLLLTGDKDRVIEVMQNIIENAIKYGDGDKISIDFNDEENVKLITINNTGCSLKEEELEHIFDSFFRGTNVGSKAGSGLGLYICKKLMTLMNGDIFAEINDGVMSVTIVIKKA